MGTAVGHIAAFADAEVSPYTTQDVFFLYEVALDGPRRVDPGPVPFPPSLGLVRLHACLSVCLSVCPPVCLSVDLPV